VCGYHVPVPAFIQRITTKHHSLRNFRYYDILVHVFVVVLLISNLVGAKISLLFGFKVSGAQLLFPITYIFGDIFTEVYGYSGSRRAIWIGFCASALMAIMGLFVVWVRPAPDWHDQAAFETVFYRVPRLIVASLIAFWPIVRRPVKPVPTPKSIRPGASLLSVARPLAATGEIRLEGMSTPVPSLIRLVARAARAMQTKTSGLSSCRVFLAESTLRSPSRSRLCRIWRCRFDA